MILNSRATSIKNACVFAVCFFALGEVAFATSWFRWSDPDGRVHLTRDRPSLGVPYSEIPVLDPIRWNSPPEMPAEIAADSRVSPQNLFKLASQSVYWILRESSPGTRGGAGATYG